MAKLGDGYEFVLVDSPAVLSVPDALAISHNVDGVLLVAGSNVRRDALRDAHQQLTRVGAKVLGIVVNGAGDPRPLSYVDYGPAPRGADRWDMALSSADGRLACNGGAAVSVPGATMNGPPAIVISKGAQGLAVTRGLGERGVRVIVLH